MAWGDEWRRAAERAQPVPRHVLEAARVGYESWDELAVRRIVAVAVWALAVRDGADPPWARVAYQLQDAGRVRALVTGALAGRDDGRTAEGDRDDAALGPAAVWRWLTRTWEQTGEFPALAWDGLPRGIARDLPDPAVDVCARWAFTAVMRALERERGAWPQGTPVAVVGGPHDGMTGTVHSAAFEADDDAEQIAGPDIPGYQIIGADGAPRIILIERLRRAAPHPSA